MDEKWPRNRSDMSLAELLDAKRKADMDFFKSIATHYCRPEKMQQFIEMIERYYKDHA